MCKLEIRATEWPKWESQKALHNVIEQTKQKEGEKEEQKEGTNESAWNMG